MKHFIVIIMTFVFIGCSNVVTGVNKLGKGIKYKEYILKNNDKLSVDQLNDLNDSIITYIDDMSYNMGADEYKETNDYFYAKQAQIITNAILKKKDIKYE